MFPFVQTVLCVWVCQGERSGDIEYVLSEMVCRFYSIGYYIICLASVVVGFGYFAFAK